MLQQINKKIIFYISLVIILGTFNNKNFKNFDLPKINMVNIIGIELNDNEYLKIINLMTLKFLLSLILLKLLRSFQYPISPRENSKNFLCYYT